MSTFYDSGAGSPTSWFDGPSSPAPDHGAGDPLGFADFPSEPDVLALGAGDPWSFVEVALGWVKKKTAARLTFSDDWISWEGGHLIEVNATGTPLTTGPYRVDMIDATGQAHPLLEAGCYSAVQGQGTEVRAELDGLSLIFSTPPLPQGVYRIRIKDSLNQMNTLQGEVLVVMSPDSLEVDAIRAGMPWRVYSGAHPDKEYPDG